MKNINARTLGVVLAILTIGFVFIMAKSTSRAHHFENALQAWNEVGVDLLYEIDQIEVFDQQNYHAYTGKRDIRDNLSRQRYMQYSEVLFEHQYKHNPETLKNFDLAIQTWLGYVDGQHDQNAKLRLHATQFCINVVYKFYKASGKNPPSELVDKIVSINPTQLMEDIIRNECGTLTFFNANPKAHKMVMLPENSPYAIDDVTLFLEKSLAFYKETDRLGVWANPDPFFEDIPEWASYATSSSNYLITMNLAMRRLYLNQRFLVISCAARNYKNKHGQYPANWKEMVDAYPSLQDINDIGYQVNEDGLKLSGELLPNRKRLTWQWH
ncbi:hypothetical protein JD969_20690 [Planctomycetota bacterium]|nr:hypothetical protein JD969_20690 [Planctomycetota bacterium]